MRMELNYTRFRILLFVGLHVAFCKWAYPWRHGSILFVFTAGAFMSCFGEMQFNLFPPINLRPMFLYGGAAMMLLAVGLVFSWR
jgi:hypothetical protein